VKGPSSTRYVCNPHPKVLAEPEAVAVSAVGRVMVMEILRNERSE
jgi:hypothetical protein